MRPLFCSIPAAFALIAGAIAYSSEALALTLTGNAYGCFGLGCTPVALATDGSKGLSFTSSSFGPITAATTVTGLPNLGVFTLGPTTAFYTGDVFNLGVSFTSPASTPSPGTYSATLTGAVTTIGGAVSVTFAVPTQTFTFAGGTFDLLINNVALQSNQQAFISGEVLASPEVIARGLSVPGPVAGAGLPALFGLAGAWFVRRRKQRVAAQSTAFQRSSWGPRAF